MIIPSLPLQPFSHYLYNGEKPSSIRELSFFLSRVTINFTAMLEGLGITKASQRTIRTISFLAHSCWKQWMRYRSEADVDGSCRPWTGGCIPQTEVALWTVNVSSLACYPSHLVKVKINFDEAQKLTWKEIKCLYGLIKIITSNHISELLKCNLKSRSRNVHT